MEIILNLSAQLSIRLLPFLIGLNKVIVTLSIDGDFPVIFCICLFKMALSQSLNFFALNAVGNATSREKSGCNQVEGKR